MNWIVFGDDFGAHPSTTSHLVRALPPSDRVVWVDSIGMRSPRLTHADMKRVWTRVRAAAPRFASKPDAPGTPSEGILDARVTPRVLPFHLDRRARALNRRALAHSIGVACQRAGFTPGEATVLAANPVAAYYVDALQPSRTVYLRLDDYAELPGVDPALARAAEAEMIQRADLVVATAQALQMPGARDSVYLPQGVDAAHFASVPTTPAPGRRTLGFFGLLAEWVDADLVLDCANAMPDVRFEFLGPIRHLDPRWAEVPNIVLRAPVPFADLPRAIEAWHGAWIPFEVSELTEAVNPLKLREYLAAGLPTASTPMPEVVAAGQGVRIVRTAEDVCQWVAEDVCTDTPLARVSRKRAMAEESWAARVAQLREALLSRSSAAAA